MADSKPARALPKSVKFDYLKGRDYRVVPVDGAFGGLTPSGKIFFAMYGERPPIPVQVEHELAGSGQLGAEVGRTSRDAIVRDVEFASVMTPETARSIADWLVKRADEIAKAAAAAQEAQTKLSSDAR